MKRTLFSLLLIPLFWACSNNQPEGEAPAMQQADDQTELAPGQEAVNDNVSNPNILQIALGSQDHTTLVAAVQACEQTTALANNGPLTVFAPTNEAFAALPEGTLDDLLKPENKMTLTTIVQHHAAPGSYDVDQLKDGQSLFVASGHNIKVEKRDGATYVHGAKILGTVKASNGLVHVVDAVLVPQ